MEFFPISVTLGILMVISYFFGRQLSHPTGWFGRVVMRGVLNQGNRAMLDSAVELLAPKPGEKIADVGFGGGYSLDRLLPLVSPEHPIGIEISEAMIASARSHWGDRVELHRSNVAALPFAQEFLDGLLTVNTIYFWADPAAALREIHRVLKPGGRLVLGMRSKAMMRLTPATWFSFRLLSTTAVQQLMEAAGFIVQMQHPRAGEWIIHAVRT